MVKLFLAILVGKLISFLTKALKTGGGSAAPGYYALKIEPKLVEKLANKIPTNVIITGTNGKTTTARILAHLAKEAGLKVIRNQTGSNLERGIASSLTNNSSLLTLNSNFDLGIWELDEAAFNSVAPKLKPDIVVFLNVFRDQLDRYGEVDSVISKWTKTLDKIDSKTTILINGDDLKLKSLKTIFDGNTETFGVEDYKIVGESLEHIGENHKLDFEAKNVKLDGLNGSHFILEIRNLKLEISLPIPGIYHIYDAVAALVAAHHLNLPVNQLTSSLTNFSPAFGRVEKIKEGYIFLIKNPAGATQVFETIIPQLKKGDRFLIALNDNFADGTDVSWIWDAQIERLEGTSFMGQVVCSGSRANDIAVRLKYAGFDTKSIMVESDLEKAFNAARVGLNGNLYVLPTYTALLELQEILVEHGDKKHYWKEEG